MRFRNVDSHDGRAALAIGIEDPARLDRGLGTEALRLRRAVPAASSREAEIEDFIEGFNQPTTAACGLWGGRVPVWSRQHGWNGL